MIGLVDIVATPGFGVGDRVWVDGYRGVIMKGPVPVRTISHRWVTVDGDTAVWHVRGSLLDGWFDAAHMEYRP